MLNFHHAIQYLLFPPLNCLILILLSLLLWSQRKICLIGVGLALILLYLQYTPWFANSLTKMIYPSISNLNKGKNIQAQAIVVLGAGAGIEFDEMGSPRAYPVGLTLLNLDYAQKVAKENPKLPIILSGGYTSAGFSEAQAMSNYLQDANNILNSQILENKSLDTDQNALYTAAKLKQMRVRNVILVTQASHMWRSAALFRKYGISCSEYPAWDEYSLQGLSFLARFSPNQSAVQQTEKILHELIGYLVYIVL